jgi:hypothetical protein
MWKLNHVDRMPTKATRWMRRGTDLHGHCEKYISRQIDHIIPPLASISETLETLRELRRRLEEAERDAGP